MKKIKLDDNRPVFQGDIMITRVAAIPNGATQKEDEIVAHSETGHHHVAKRAKVFTGPDGMTLYMQAIGKTVDLVHMRPTDTHETIRLYGNPGSVWKIQRQREFTPQGLRRVED